MIRIVVRPAVRARLRGGVRAVEGYPRAGRRRCDRDRRLARAPRPDEPGFERVEERVTVRVELFGQRITRVTVEVDARGWRGDALRAIGDTRGTAREVLARLREAPSGLRATRRGASPQGELRWWWAWESIWSLISRIRRAMERWQDRFLRRVFTEEELAYSLGRRNPAEHLAARFAAKEATLKALGTGLSMGVRWREMEVRRPGGSRRPSRSRGGPRPSARPGGSARSTSPSPTTGTRPWRRFWRRA